MAKPKCKLGGKCFYQKRDFYSFSFDDGDSYPYRKYQNSNRKRQDEDGLTLVIDDTCRRLERPIECKRCNINGP